MPEPASEISACYQLIEETDENKDHGTQQDHEDAGGTQTGVACAAEFNASTKRL